MKKRPTINDVLNEFGFSISEKEAFIKCIKAVKEEQINDNVDSQKEMEKIIESVVEHEI